MDLPAVEALHVSDRHVVALHANSPLEKRREEGGRRHLHCCIGGVTAETCEHCELCMWTRWSTHLLDLGTSMQTNVHAYFLLQPKVLKGGGVIGCCSPVPL